MFRIFLRCLSVVLVVSFASCAKTTKFGEVPSIHAERKIGEEQAPLFIRSRGGLYSDPKLTRYVNEITDRLVATASVPEGYRPLNVQILDSNEPGAFALPGGKIFVSRGMIAFADDEAQLAGVIAHEIAHVMSRHIAKGLAANQQLILEIVRQKDETLRETSETQAIAIIEQEMEARIDDITAFSKEQELEADRLGIQIASAAGYDTSGFGDFLKRLEAYDKQQVKRVGLDSAQLEEIGKRSGYPKLTDRVAALGAVQTVPKDAAARDRLMSSINNMRFDDRYQGGIVRNGVYWNPSHRIAFDVPSAVVPIHGVNIQLLSRYGLITARLDHPFAVTFSELVESMDQVEEGSSDFKLTTINESPAIVHKLETNDGDREWLSEVAILDFDGGVVAFLMVTEREKETLLRPIFSRILNSLRKTENGEFPQSRRYETRRIQPGETVSSLLAGSKFEESGETDLRLLNGLGAAEEPPAGSWIKLIN